MGVLVKFRRWKEKLLHHMNFPTLSYNCYFFYFFFLIFFWSCLTLFNAIIEDRNGTPSIHVHSTNINEFLLQNRPSQHNGLIQKPFRLACDSMGCQRLMRIFFASNFILKEGNPVILRRRKSKNIRIFQISA